MNERTKYTILGALSALFFGIGLPLGRIGQEKIGVMAYVGMYYLLQSIFILTRSKERLTFSKAEIRHPAFFLRWLFFVMHEACATISIGVVSAPGIPLVILINYLWPTAVILCSIQISGLHIPRKGIFIFGLSIVLASLAFEILGGFHLDTGLFDKRTDVFAYIATFIGAISWGLYSAITRSFSAETGGAKALPLYQLSLGLALPLSLLPALHVPWALTWMGIAVLIIHCSLSASGFVCWDKGVHKGNIVVVSLFADFIPWISLLATSIIHKIPIGSTTIISAFSLVVGALITRYATVSKAN